MFEWLLGPAKPLLPKTVTNVNSAVVPTGVPATQGTVAPSQAANVAAAGTVARQPPSEIVVQPRRGEYVALGGSRKGGKSKSKKAKKSRKGKSKKASKSRK